MAKIDTQMVILIIAVAFCGMLAREVQKDFSKESEPSLDTAALTTEIPPTRIPMITPLPTLDPITVAYLCEPLPPNMFLLDFAAKLERIPREQAANEVKGPFVVIRDIHGVKVKSPEIDEINQVRVMAGEPQPDDEFCVERKNVRQPLVRLFLPLYMTIHVIFLKNR